MSIRSVPPLKRFLSLVLLIALLLTLIPSAVLAAPAPAPAAAPVASASGTHTVTYGDTLSGIAVSHGVSMQALMAANGISNPNHIYVGQVLRIPGGGSSGGWSGGYGCSAYYTVKPGDGLYRIAGWYGSDAYAIAQANNLLNLNAIYAGQVLCIPGGGVPQTPPPAQTSWYTVQPGDNLFRISQRFGTTVNALMALNGISNPNRIVAGQVLRVSGASMPPPVVVPPVVVTPPAGLWTGLYYPNKDLSGTPALVRQDSDIKFNWGEGIPAAGLPADNFSVLWTRTFDYAGGTYRFFATADDGVRVYVDNVMIINAWREQPATSYFGDVYLSPGTHAIRVDYFEATQVASIYVYWAKQ